MAKNKEIKTNAMRILEKEKIPYTHIQYECEEFVDAIHVSDMLGQEYHAVFKTLVTAGKTGEHYVFCIPIDKELDLKKAAKSVGEKSVSMITVKELFPLTGYVRGGCTPIGMKKQFVTVMDASAEGLEEMIISGGRIGSQLKLSPARLLAVTKGIFADIISDTPCNS